MLVGEYIHYRYKNYRQHGLSRKEGARPRSVSKVFNDQRSMILKNLLVTRDQSQKVSIKSSLESQLNFFFNPGDVKSLQTGYTSDEAQQIQEKIISLCQDAIGNVGDKKINWGDLSGVTNKSYFGDDLNKEFESIRKTRLGDGKSATTRQAVSRRLKALMDLRDRLNNEMIDGSVDWEFVDKLNKFEQEYQQIISPLIENRNGQNVQTASGSTKQKFSVVRHGAFIRDLQELIDDTKKITLQQLNQLLGDYVPVLTQAVFQNVAEKGLEDTLKHLKLSDLTIPIIGKTQSEKAVVSTNIISKKGASKNLQTEAIIGDIPAKLGNTFDKVDIQLTIPNGELVNASVKNLSAKTSEIALLNGKSLLYYLQDYPEFANHYLNVTSSHPAKDDSKPMASTIEMAHNVAKLTVVFHALAGYTQGRSSGSDYFSKTPMSEIMIVNSRGGGGGRFSVIFMSDIINKVASNLDLIDMQNFNSSPQWSNGYVGSKPSFRMAYGRISNILGQLHSFQLRASIKTKAFS